MFSSDLTDYVIRQLGRTKNKRYEAYVVSRIIHLLNDFTLKFVTQQFVRLSNKKIALADLKDGVVWKRVACEVKTYSPKEAKC